MAWDVEVAAQRSLDGWIADVTLRKGALEHPYRVRVPEDAWRRLTGGRASPEELLRASFAFLLEREPPESILQAFEITVIPRYFPEYERVIRDQFEVR